MFGRKKESTMTTIERVDTIVGKESVFTGTLKAMGSVRIDGQLNGEILGKGDIVIGETGKVEAAIEGRNVIIAGTLRGNVDASGRLEIASTGRLYGDLQAASLVIDEGAVFHGSSRTERCQSTIAEVADDVEESQVEGLQVEGAR
ncbi:cell shape determination protein CcmA [Heliobacillus mobilis]|uniref:Cell shape determination protein CcmA n=1 Tax=Heliobacterium mobile TaxID=28064 RepID=A0A6I3SPH2_HELMO|nr:polymer-forming cytoskeletal protein [Heliobacterium mobile]MTV50585.1 cell shape determination protein CcmA [Heliobacterium mobile]